MNRYRKWERDNKVRLVTSKLFNSHDYLFISSNGRTHGRNSMGTVMGEREVRQILIEDNTNDICPGMQVIHKGKGVYYVTSIQRLTPGSWVRLRPIKFWS